MPPFGFDDVYEIEPSPNDKSWGKVSAITVVTPEDKEKLNQDEDKKKLFGIELAKDHASAFEAACVLFPDTGTALWVSLNWLCDPTVIAAKDIYLETVKLTQPILDKSQLAAKVLELAEAKSLDGTRYLIDAKDRIDAFKLYATIAGYIGKVDVDASIKNSVNNFMTIKLVRPENKTIDVIPNNKSEISNDDKPPVRIKLVK